MMSCIFATQARNVIDGFERPNRSKEALTTALLDR
jgi:hypothetical protein